MRLARCARASMIVSFVILAGYAIGCGSEARQNGPTAEARERGEALTKSIRESVQKKKEEAAIANKRGSKKRGTPNPRPGS